MDETTKPNPKTIYTSLAHNLAQARAAGRAGNTEQAAYFTRQAKAWNSLANRHGVDPFDGR